MRGLHLLSVLVGSLILYSAPVWAQEEQTVPPPPPALLQEPSEAVSVIKQIVTYLDPVPETVLDFWNGDQYAGISGSIWNWAPNQVNVASLRLGASTGMAVYGGAGLDLHGVSTYLPQWLRDVASTGATQTLWEKVGEYGHASVVGGWSFDHDDPVLGGTLGIKIPLGG